MALWQHDDDDFLSQNRKNRARSKTVVRSTATNSGDGRAAGGGVGKADLQKTRRKAPNPEKGGSLSSLLKVSGIVGVGFLLVFLLLGAVVEGAREFGQFFRGDTESSQQNDGEQSSSQGSSQQETVEYYDDAELKSACYHVKNNAGADLLLFLYTVPGYHMNETNSGYPYIEGCLTSSSVDSPYCGLSFGCASYDCDWNEETRAMLHANCYDGLRNNHGAPFTSISNLYKYDSSKSYKIQIRDHISNEVCKEIPVEIKDVTQAEMDAIVSEWATQYNMDTAPDYSSWNS